VAEKLSESFTPLERSDMSSEQDEVGAWQSASRLWIAVAGQRAVNSIVMHRKSCIASA
jgi:hypothetical protein